MFVDSWDLENYVESFQAVVNIGVQPHVSRRPTSFTRMRTRSPSAWHLAPGKDRRMGFFVIHQYVTFIFYFISDKIRSFCKFAFHPNQLVSLCCKIIVFK